MVALVQQLLVSSRPEVEYAIQSFIAQGYTVRNWSARSASITG